MPPCRDAGGGPGGWGKRPGQARESVRGVHETQDAHSATGTRTFAGQRPFQEDGKSQKSLDRQNPPLTIEQVRELLNKNK